MTPQVDQAAERSSPDVAGAGVVAWYAEGFRDGLGDRLLLFDNAGPGLELLRVNGDFSRSDGFESLLRARVEALQGFRHASFAQVRAVKWLDEARPTLAVVSDHLPGERLSRVLRLARARGLRPSADAVVWMLRKVLPALASLQERQGIAHGLLTADRIVVAPDGSLAIADHVFGGAIERLRFAPFELWDRFGVAVDATTGLSRQGDVAQLARLAIAMLVERVDVSSPGPVPAVDLILAARERLDGPQDRRLADWLARALGVEVPAFYTAREAENALDGMLPARLGEWAKWLLPLPPERRAIASCTAQPDDPDAEDDGPEMAATVMMSRAELEALGAAAAAAAARAAGEVPAVLVPLIEQKVRRHRFWRHAAIGLAIVATIEGAVLVGGRWRTSPVPVPAVASPAPQTPAPIQPSLPAAAALQSPPAAPPPALQPRRSPPAPGPAATNDAAPAALARGVIGWLSVRSDVPLKVYANGRMLGEGSEGTYRLPAGEHEVVLVNEDAGVNMRQPVHIVSGQTVSIVRLVGGR